MKCKKCVSAVPHSKDSYTPPGSDEALDQMINSSLWNCQGCNLSAMMLTEALATTTELGEEKKSNGDLTIQLEILVSLILIVVALFVGINLQTERVETPVDINRVSRWQ